MPKHTRTKDSQSTLNRDQPALAVKWRWFVAALAAVTFTVAYPVLKGAFLVNPHSDQYIAGFGFRDFAAQSLRQGNGFPQWNAYMFGGLPYVAAMHGDIFYPTFLLRMIMRTDLAMTWGFVIHLFLAGAFTLGFLRALGLARWPAAFGALAYMMSGPVASYASPGHDGKLFVSALLPLALWMLTRGIRDGVQWAWGVFALAVGLAVLSPHPQLLQYFLLTNGVYALFLVWQGAGVTESAANHAATGGGPSGAKNVSGAANAARGALDIRYITTKLGIALGMVLLGLGIGAIQYWPVLGYVNSSPRANGREYEFASQYSFPPEELFNTYLPQFSGMLEMYAGRNLIHLHSEYLGVLVLMLAPLAFGAGSRKALARFWLGTAIVSLLWALGGFTPFFHLVYLVPGTKYFRAPSTIFYVCTLSVCVLSALGLERLLNRSVRATLLNRYLVGWCAFAGIVGLLGATGALTTLAQRIGTEVVQARGFDRIGFASFIDANKQALMMGGFRSLAVVLISTALIAAFLRRKVNATVLAVAACMLCGVDLWSVSRKYWIFWDPARALYAPDAITSYLNEQTQPGRVFVYTKTADYRTAYDPYFGGHGFGEGAGFMVHGIRTVSGYQGNVLARFEQLTAGNALVSPAFWQHENVRWLYTNMNIADTVFKKIVGPIQNAAGSTAYLYAMPVEAPYAWVATGYGASSDERALKDVLESKYDPRSFVAFEPNAKVGAPLAAVPALMPVPSTITTTVTKFGAGYATIELSAPSEPGNALVVSENYYKGWRATTTGVSAKGASTNDTAPPVARAAYNLVGIPLPAGTRSLTLTFQDERYPAGRLITLIALALTAILITLGLWLRSRKTRDLPQTSLP